MERTGGEQRSTATRQCCGHRGLDRSQNKGNKATDSTSRRRHPHHGAHTSLVERPVGQALRKTVWNFTKIIKDPYSVTLQIHYWAFFPEKCQRFLQKTTPPWLFTAALLARANTGDDPHLPHAQSGWGHWSPRRGGYCPASKTHQPVTATTRTGLRHACE